MYHITKRPTTAPRSITLAKLNDTDLAAERDRLLLAALVGRHPRAAWAERMAGIEARIARGGAVMVARHAGGLGGYGPPPPPPSPGAILTREALLRLFRPLHDDYTATIVLTADLPNKGRRAVIDARHEAYTEALAEVLTGAIDTSAEWVRGGKVVRR